MPLSKNVALWGCKKIATDFYMHFKNEIHIEYAISNNSSEINFCPESGVDIPVHRPTTQKSGGGERLYYHMCQ